MYAVLRIDTLVFHRFNTAKKSAYSVCLFWFFCVWTYKTQYTRTFKVPSNLNRFVLDRESEVLLFFPLQQLALFLVVISYCITIAKH